MLLFAPEQVELEYRETYRRHFQHLIEETDWVRANARSTYAGYEIDEAAGGIIYVGFTAEPDATLDRLRKRLIASARFRPFPIAPRAGAPARSRVRRTLPGSVPPLP